MLAKGANQKRAKAGKKERNHEKLRSKVTSAGARGKENNRSGDGGNKKGVRRWTQQKKYREKENFGKKARNRDGHRDRGLPREAMSPSFTKKFETETRTPRSNEKKSLKKKGHVSGGGGSLQQVNRTRVRTPSAERR